MIAELNSQIVATFLSENPQFFAEHVELLASVKLTSPVLGRAISLQERQMEILRQKLRDQDLHLADLLRIAEENDSITDKFQNWTRALLLARNDADLPRLLLDQLAEIFNVPQVALRLWNVSAGHAEEWFSTTVSEDARIFTNGLTTAFCGPNQDFEAVTWLAEPAQVQSVAMLPLRGDTASETFGLLVLGSSDPERFSAAMATDFLVKIAATASAALACLRA
ncbi:DUF484 family protein [Herbaspirillum sp. RTI4]|uniref:DUF484 family protein n=1 Tax=Herbaspirillum sp. RTI4 TaxID=3048640 RepID=UPI002AB40DBF|nr:DUF484 family protein [Herbaspirillum sp. RTI4]MDY7576929.1 DUF484 family protein [Herbaspirillum sp. RTI4]MEA9983200.1 DUF484 family protein [Herbaspirillum sp. RTI4]